MINGKVNISDLIMSTQNIQNTGYTRKFYA